MSQSFVLQRAPPGLTSKSAYQCCGAGIRAVEMWLARRQGWQELSLLDDRMLKDVGVTREQVFQRCREPFWSA